MKKVLFIVSVVMILSLLACEQSADPDPEVGGTNGGAGTGGTGEEQITQVFSFPYGSFKMIYCPGGTFLPNEDDSDPDFDDGAEASCDPFWISETEVTNELLAWIFEDSSGTFNYTDSDAHNYCCDEYVRWGGQDLMYMGETLWDDYDIVHGTAFSARSGLEDYPCTDITWYGAVTACNRLTEGLGPGASSVVYSGIGEDWRDDYTVCDFNKTGFRLPTVAEWECAARWQGNSCSVNAYEWPAGNGIYWTCGGCASGASDTTDNVSATSSVAVYEYDSEGFANPEDREAIKGERQSNALGLYDMSGNVWEWCFDEDGSGNSRISRGGSAQSKYNDVRIVSRAIMTASGTGSDLGFRLVMSAE